METIEQTETLEPVEPGNKQKIIIITLIALAICAMFYFIGTKSNNGELSANKKEIEQLKSDIDSTNMDLKIANDSKSSLQSQYDSVNSTILSCQKSQAWSWDHLIKLSASLGSLTSDGQAILDELNTITAETQTNATYAKACDSLIGSKLGL